ncbi:HigA family addiction module antitoxin [Gallibacterium trehalosifermentans]|uniref:HigA family addiction module antitoxin n=1 Tax=Gallibacterium trehalosifermentans TaxID=516935 RepID=A0ABV6GZ07_9PAST
MYNPAHPGEILREYIDGFSVTDIAQKLGVTRVTLSRILNAKAAVSPEMALRLSHLLKTSPEFWLTMQVNYDLQQANQRLNIAIEPLFN